MSAARNVRGGKAFKKGKKGGGAAGGDDERAYRFSGRDDDQDYARIVRLLGDRRALCFCNDGYERVGKFRGAICRGPRKQIIRVGDIVLISYREFQEEGTVAAGAATADAATGKALTTDSGHKEIVDIMHRYDPRDLRHIRKEVGIHPSLLGAVPTEGGAAAADDIFFDGDEPAAAAAAAVKKAAPEDDDDEDEDLDIDAI